MIEIWKAVHNEFSHLYEVSNLGRIRRIGGEPSSGNSVNGYRYFLLCDGMKHRKKRPTRR